MQFSAWVRYSTVSLFDIFRLSEYISGGLVNINASVSNTFKSQGIWWGLESGHPEFTKVLSYVVVVVVVMAVVAVEVAAAAAARCHL